VSPPTGLYWRSSGFALPSRRSDRSRSVDSAGGPETLSTGPSRPSRVSPLGAGAEPVVCRNSTHPDPAKLWAFLLVPPSRWSWQRVAATRVACTLWLRGALPPREKPPGAGQPADHSASRQRERHRLCAVPWTPRRNATLLLPRGSVISGRSSFGTLCGTAEELGTVACEPCASCSAGHSRSLAHAQAPG
jgi:hypothetical protein